MGETEKKCFIEEIPDETMVIGEWSIQLLSIVPSLWWYRLCCEVASAVPDCCVTSLVLSETG